MIFQPGSPNNCSKATRPFFLVGTRRLANLCKRQKVHCVAYQLAVPLCMNVCRLQYFQVLCSHSHSNQGVFHTSALSFCITQLLTIGAHAQRGLRYFVCLSVCLCVYTYSRTTGNEAGDEQYQQLQNSKRSTNKNGDFAKTTAFEIEKPAQSRTTLRDPAHQLPATMHVGSSPTYLAPQALRLPRFVDLAWAVEVSCPRLASGHQNWLCLQVQRSM